MAYAHSQIIITSWLFLKLDLIQVFQTLGSQNDYSSLDFFNAFREQLENIKTKFKNTYN